MRNELFEYAINTLIYKNLGKTNHSILFYNIACAICVSLVMIAISIPIMISKIYLWIILLAIWGLMLLFRKKERNAYVKAILIDSMCCIYSAYFLSFILINFSKPEAKGLLTTILIIVMCLFLLPYEVVFLIRLFKKKYSKMKQGGLSQDNKEESNALITTLSSIGAFLGIVLYKILPKSNLYSAYDIMFIVIISTLWFCGLSLAQKYIILKLQKYK